MGLAGTINKKSYKRTSYIVYTHPRTLYITKSFMTVDKLYTSPTATIVMAKTDQSVSTEPDMKNPFYLTQKMMSAQVVKMTLLDIFRTTLTCMITLEVLMAYLSYLSSQINSIYYHKNK